MVYKLIPTKRFIKQLKKLDEFTQQQIIHYLETRASENPRQYGKALTANRTGQWRYRIGSYRVIVEIIDSQLIITTLEVGHRKNIY